jgi:hypothetical protein
MLQHNVLLWRDILVYARRVMRKHNLQLAPSKRKKVAVSQGNPSPLRCIISVAGDNRWCSVIGRVTRETCPGEQRPPPDIASRSVAHRDRDVQVIVSGNGHSVVQINGSKPERHSWEHKLLGRRRSERKRQERRKSEHKRLERRRSGRSCCSHCCSNGSCGPCST